MIPKKIALFGLIFLSLAQWYVAGKMIQENEDIIKEGQLINLRTAPLDPNDPFRGKYITLSFSDISMNVTNASDWSYNDPAYITFRLDSSGFAIPTNIFREIPTNSESYLKVKVRNVISSHEEQTIFIDYPFDRFYLEETKAPQIEEKYREALADSSIQTFARIYVQSGKGVIEDIYIGERRIGDLAR